MTTLCEERPKQARIALTRVAAFRKEREAWGDRVSSQPSAFDTWRDELWGYESVEARIHRSFEQFVRQGVDCWESIGAYHDGLQLHRLECDHDHSRHFESFEKAVARFHTTASFVVDILAPAFKQKFGRVRLAAELSACRDEAKLIISPPDLEVFMD